MPWQKGELNTLPQPLLLTTLTKNPFENIVRKGENVGKKTL